MCVCVQALLKIIPNLHTARCLPHIGTSNFASGMHNLEKRCQNKRVTSPFFCACNSNLIPQTPAGDNVYCHASKHFCLLMLADQIAIKGTGANQERFVCLFVLTDQVATSSM